jgi:hypothetical protein
MLLASASEPLKANRDLRLPLKDHIIQKFNVCFEDWEFQAESSEHSTGKQRHVRAEIWRMIFHGYQQ